MPLIPRATRGLQWDGQWVATPKGEANLETISQLGLPAVTRRHERGIPSNRVSTSHGEYVSAPCTHRPSLHPSAVGLKNRPRGEVKILLREEGEVVTR
jgi:hypothetical protein